MNMSKQVSVAANAAVNEGNNPRVINTTIMGARRLDATTSDGSSIEGVVILLRESIPAVINGEPKAINKKWFAVNNVIDALIMSEDDNVAALAANVLDGDYMSLRGLTAIVSVFNGDDDELHYKLEF